MDGTCWSRRQFSIKQKQTKKANYKHLNSTKASTLFFPACAPRQATCLTNSNDFIDQSTLPFSGELRIRPFDSDTCPVLKRVTACLLSFSGGGCTPPLQFNCPDEI